MKTSDHTSEMPPSRSSLAVWSLKLAGSAIFVMVLGVILFLVGVHINVLMCIFVMHMLCAVAGMILSVLSFFTSSNNGRRDTVYGVIGFVVCFGILVMFMYAPSVN